MGLYGCAFQLLPALHFLSVPSGPLWLPAYTHAVHGHQLVHQVHVQQSQRQSPSPASICNPLLKKP